MSLARRRISKGRLILGLFGFLIIAAASFLIARANFANALVELPDDWSLELVFFDEDVNNGKDPITNLQWTIDESTPYDKFTKVIKLQVNYRNENVDRTYEPGELKISVPNPFDMMQYSCRDDVMNSEIYCIDSNYAVTISANLSGQSKYDWDYAINGGSLHFQRFEFVNRVPFEINANVEGSIQIAFEVTSTDSYLQYVDEHTTTFDYADYSHNPFLKATMNNITSNPVEFHYSRHVTHAWSRLTYNINKYAYKLSSYDSLGDNAEDYIWVRYVFRGSSNEYFPMNGMGDFPIDYYQTDYDTGYGEYYIGLKEYEMADKFPDGVKVLDFEGNELTANEDGYIVIKREGSVFDYPTSPYCHEDWSCEEIIVGYPKSQFNDDLGTMNITNKIELRGIYSDRDTKEVLAEDEVDINLADFVFNYTPGRSYLSKQFCSKSSYGCYPQSVYYYQDIVSENGASGAFKLTAYSFYPGVKYDLIIGDDLIYAIDEDGSSGILSDDNYYVSHIGIVDTHKLKNANEVAISLTKYHPVLYVRHKNSTDYVEYKQYDSLSINDNFTKDDDIHSWYLLIENVDESFYNFNVRTDITLNMSETTKTGTFYNFGFLKQMKDGNLLNPAVLDNYANNITKEVVAAYDLEHHGSYILRASDFATWAYQTMGPATVKLEMFKRNNGITQYDPDGEFFFGSYNVVSHAYWSAKDQFSDPKMIAEQLQDEDWYKEANYYDLLPFGMDINGTEAEIAATAGDFMCGGNIHSSQASNNYYNKDGEAMFPSGRNECAAYMKNRTTVIITKNWHNTGRTHVAVRFDFSDAPFFTMGGSSMPSITIPYKVSMDSYIEIGRSYENYAYATTNNFDGANYSYQLIRDNGVKDSQAIDINDDGSTEDNVVFANVTVSLISASPSRQDIQTSVLTNHNGKYDTDPALSGYNEDYSYKLRVRTGPNRVTNLVLYEHLEEEYGTNEHWQGNFGGINTEYAETRLDYYDNPVQIKVYWSEKSDAGSLKTDTSWQEYDEDTTDKTKVRSIAFEYLDQEGNPAILPQSFYTYVIVDMKAPDGENIMSLAYNNSHSEWNAIDNLTGELIYNITGIESNVVVVFLSETFDLTVKKEWSDYNNHYGIRPDTITFNLLKGSDVVDTKELNVANGETQVVFSGLSTPDQNLYSVQEVVINEYQSSSVKNDIGVITFTNTITRDDPGTGGDPDPDPDPDPTGDDVLPKTNDNIRTFFLGGAIAIAVSATGFVVIRRRR
ncbi:MAG: Cna B-type domain-containing protein [Candidatus Saccharibacteria bacterium]|nr:Cna B-type domain-containing protein [Candidatus Saccharibacteria bacterium]